MALGRKIHCDYCYKHPAARALARTSASTVREIGAASPTQSANSTTAPSSASICEEPAMQASIRHGAPYLPFPNF